LGVIAPNYPQLLPDSLYQRAKMLTHHALEMLRRRTGLAHATIGGRNQCGVNDLSTHGEIALFAQLPVKPLHPRVG